MDNPRYRDLEKLIREYELDTKTIQSNKLIIINYPQFFTMSVASSFEYYVKQDLDAFLLNPLHPITIYPTVHQMVSNNNTTPVSERMYKKFHTKPTFTADPFYQLFGGATFKTSVQNHFTNERSQELSVLQSRVTALETLINNSNEDYEKYVDEYVELDDRKERLNQLTFDIAEQAFLNLKSCRNKVAHDFIHGLTNSFVELRNFYYDAIIYVIALSKAISDLTQQTT